MKQASVPYYVNALSPELSELWSGHVVYDTPQHISEMCGHRMVSSFLADGFTELENRRRLLYALLDGPFATDRTDDILNILSGTLPVDTFLPKVVAARATLYNDPVSRTWDEATTHAILDALYRDNAFDGRLQEAYRTAIAHSGCIVGAYVGTRGRVQIEILTPDLARYETAAQFPDQLVSLTKPLLRFTDEDGMPLAQGESVVVFQRWTSDTIFYEDGAGEPAPYPLGPPDEDGPTFIVEQPNPYGRIPYTVMRLVEPNSMATFGGGLAWVAEACLNANRLRFLADTSSMYESFGHIVAINLGLSSGDARIGFGRITALDGVESGAETGKAEPAMAVVTQAGQYTSIAEYRTAYIEDVLRTAGLPESMISQQGGTPPSGISRHIERLGLLDLRRSDALNLRWFEQELSDLVIAVYNTDVARERGLPEIVPATLSVTFPDEQLILEPDRQLDVTERKFSAGLLTPAQYVRELTGTDMSDEDAVAYLLSNRAALSQPDASAGTSDGTSASASADAAASASTSASPDGAADAAAAGGGSAASELRASVGGSAQIAERQAEFYEGKVPREAVLANLVHVLGFTPAEAEALLPNVLPKPLADIAASMASADAAIETDDNNTPTNGA